MERMDHILLTYLCHPPCYLSDGSRLDRPSTFDKRQEHWASTDGRSVLVVSPMAVGDTIADK
jgi:hypothetical protein